MFCVTTIEFRNILVLTPSCNLSRNNVALRVESVVWRVTNHLNNLPHNKGWRLWAPNALTNTLGVQGHAPTENVEKVTPLECDLQYFQTKIIIFLLQCRAKRQAYCILYCITRFLVWHKKYLWLVKELFFKNTFPWKLVPPWRDHRQHWVIKQVTTHSKLRDKL